MEDEKLRYPVGKFIAPSEFSQKDIDKWIYEIQELPSQCQNELSDFTEVMLNESYRPHGWTARQVIHHIVDSHMNAYIRFKLALTEDLPAIRPYKEDRWAELSDSRNSPPEISLSLLHALHRRWIIVIKNMKTDEFDRKYFHPESKKEFTLKTALALYAWHSRHHLEHIRIVKRKFVPVKS
jgi:hypothetical protein